MARALQKGQITSRLLDFLITGTPPVFRHQKNRCGNQKVSDWSNEWTCVRSKHAKQSKSQCRAAIATAFWYALVGNNTMSTMKRPVRNYVCPRTLLTSFNTNYAPVAPTNSILRGCPLLPAALVSLSEEKKQRERVKFGSKNHIPHNNSQSWLGQNMTSTSPANHQSPAASEDSTFGAEDWQIDHARGDYKDNEHGSSCVSEGVYLQNDAQKWCLFAMLVGITDDTERELGDTEVSPYKEMRLRKCLVPTVKHLIDEIHRRCNVYNWPCPSCRYWDKKKLVAWLKENPIDYWKDRQWLIKEELHIRNMLLAAYEERANNSGGIGWADNKAMCRIYCAMYDDRARPFFDSKDDVMTRTELDARNNEDRPPTVWEKIAELVNDQNHVYVLPARPELHQAFSSVLTLDYDDCCPGDLTADEAKKRIADARAKLMKVIARWELSGNGFGQRAAGDDLFGHVDEEQLEDGDNRARFLDGIGKEHLLMLWDMSDREGLLGKFLSKLSPAVAVSCDNVSTDTAEVQNPRRQSEEQNAQRRFRDSVASSMQTMSYSALMKELRESEMQILKLTEFTWSATTDAAVSFYEECLERERERKVEITEEINTLKRRRVE
jgi:hypothetical protein